MAHVSTGTEAAGRGNTFAGRLTRAGFADAARAARMFLDEPLALACDDPVETLLGPLSDVADPDQALLALVKIAGAAGSDPANLAVLQGLLAEPGPGRDRLLAVIGASVALGDNLASHPDHLAVLADDAPATGVHRPAGRCRRSAGMMSAHWRRQAPPEVARLCRPARALLARAGGRGGRARAPGEQRPALFRP